MQRIVNEPKKLIGADVPFQRLRRITGYLVGSTTKWNDAKLCELNDRVKHNTTPESL